MTKLRKISRSKSRLTTPKRPQGSGLVAVGQLVEDEATSSKGNGRLSRVQPRVGQRAEQRRKKLQRLRNSNALEAPTEFDAASTESGSTVSDSAGRTIRKTQHQGFRKSRKKSNGTRTSVLPLQASLNSKSKPARPQRRAEDDRRKNRKAPAERYSALDGYAVSDSDTAGRYRIVEPPPPVHESYKEWFQRVIVRNRWMTWFTAFYFHWVVLLVMAAILVNGPESTVNLLLNAAFAEDFEPDTRPFEVVAPMPSASEVEDAARPDPAVVDTEPSTMSETNLSLNSSVVDELSKSDSPSIQTDKTPPTDSEVTPPHQVRQMPLIVPEDAVSEGSFSVWTEPSQPIAGKPYRIVIQVRLPDGLKKYDVSDLQGMVVGSDGYRKPVPGSVRGGLPIDSGYARLVVPIVSADAQVRDTVFIRSKLLRESQKLVLQF